MIGVWWANCQNCYSGDHATEQCGYLDEPWEDVVRKSAEPTHDVDGVR